MDSVTQPLRDEHKELLPQIERVRRVADSIGVVPTEVLRQRVDELHRFLSRELIPHAKAEEAVLYPLVARAIGAPEATATMRHDHVEIAGLADELASIEPELSDETLSLEAQHALRRILYGLYTLVRVHFIEEEEIYLPLLDERLDPEEARDMFNALEAAAAHAKGLATA